MFAALDGVPASVLAEAVQTHVGLIHKDPGVLPRSIPNDDDEHTALWHTPYVLQTHFTLPFWRVDRWDKFLARLRCSCRCFLPGERHLELKPKLCRMDLPLQALVGLTAFSESQMSADELDGGAAVLAHVIGDHRKNPATEGRLPCCSILLPSSLPRPIDVPSSCVPTLASFGVTRPQSERNSPVTV